MRNVRRGLSVPNKLRLRHRPTHGRTEVFTGGVDDTAPMSSPFCDAIIRGKRPWSCRNLLPQPHIDLRANLFVQSAKRNMHWLHPDRYQRSDNSGK